MSQKYSPFRSILFVLGFLFGTSFMIFFGKSKGEDNRRELLKKWEDGENVAAVKTRIYAREVLGALYGFPDATKEIIESPKMKEVVEEGKKTVGKIRKEGIKRAKKVAKNAEEVIGKGAKIVKTDVKKAKKKTAEVLRKVSGFKKVIKKS